MDNNSASASTLGPIRQLGYVVEDLDRALQAWSTHLRVGPWTIIRNITLHSVFRGAPSQPRIDIALGYLGEVQIELIQQTNDAASPYRTFIDAERFGLHHTAFLSEKIHEEVERLQKSGMVIACDINMPTGGRYVYFDSPVPGENTYIELLEFTPTMKQMFDHGIPAAARWDGHTPPVVIDFASMAKSSA